MKILVKLSEDQILDAGAEMLDMSAFKFSAEGDMTAVVGSAGEIAFLIGELDNMFDATALNLIVN